MRSLDISSFCFLRAGGSYRGSFSQTLTSDNSVSTNNEGHAPRLCLGPGFRFGTLHVALHLLLQSRLWELKGSRLTSTTLRLGPSAWLYTVHVAPRHLVSKTPSDKSSAAAQGVSPAAEAAFASPRSRSWGEATALCLGLGFRLEALDVVGHHAPPNGLWEGTGSSCSH